MADLVEKTGAAVRTAAVERIEPERSAKLRASDHDAADRLADRHDTTSKHVISWWRETFESAPDQLRDTAKTRVDRRYPRSRQRRGRGNRKRAA